MSSVPTRDSIIMYLYILYRCPAINDVQSCNQLLHIKLRSAPVINDVQSCKHLLHVKKVKLQVIQVKKLKFQVIQIKKLRFKVIHLCKLGS